jgi:protein TonB
MLLGLRKPAAPSQAVPVTQMVEVELPQPAATPEPLEPEPPEPEIKPPAPEPAPRVRETKAEVSKPVEPARTEVPPPAAAQAAQVLTQEAEVADFGEAIVVGNAAIHAGGVTEAGGTSARAVRDSGARAGGVEGGTGHDLTADRSRQPMLAGGNQWDCPFPEEADEDGVQSGDVTLRVEVGGDGSVLDVQVKDDPGYGFGREAKRCAMRKRWAAGLDRAGNPTRAIAVVRVKFER